MQSQNDTPERAARLEKALSTGDAPSERDARAIGAAEQFPAETKPARCG